MPKQKTVVRKRGRPPKKLTIEEAKIKKLALSLKETRRQLRVYRKQFALVQCLDELLARLLEETVPHWCFEYPWYVTLHETMRLLDFKKAGSVGFLPEHDPEIGKDSLCAACRHAYFEHISLHGRASGRVGCLQCDCSTFVLGEP
jgi:hypothetical protein